MPGQMIKTREWCEMEINKFTFLGIVSWIGGLGLLIFQAISTVMEKEQQWTAIFLGDFISTSLDGLMAKIPVDMIRSGMNYITYDLPFYQFLLAAGAVFFIIGMIFRD